MAQQHGQRRPQLVVPRVPYLLQFFRGVAPRTVLLLLLLKNVRLEEVLPRSGATERIRGVGWPFQVEASKPPTKLQARELCYDAMYLFTSPRL